LRGLAREHHPDQAAGSSRGWPYVLGRIVDDDDRTRRAILLLWNLTAALMGIGVMTITVTQLAHLAGRCTGICAGLSTVIVLWRLR
jgi:hypothetical protein